MSSWQLAIKGNKGATASCRWQTVQMKEACSTHTKKNVCKQLGNEKLWENCSRDEATAAKIMKYSLRGLAVVHELLVLPGQSFPVKMFRLLTDPNVADEVITIKRESPCLLDSFSLRHLESFPTKEELLSPTALRVLRSVAFLLIGNIFSTESQHSKTSRRSRHRLTHSIALPDLALWLQSDATPAMMQAPLHHKHPPQQTRLKSLLPKVFWTARSSCAQAFSVDHKNPAPCRLLEIDCVLLRYSLV